MLPGSSSMSQKFIFEELDEATHNYLIAVRENEGAGAPGVFAPTSSSMAGCGCIGGPIIILVTLLFTLTSWIDVIYDDPVRVALLQTAGLLLGGWLLLAGVRSSASKGSKRVAGHWVYVDPLHMYEALREQVTVTRVDDAIEANFTHNYNNGNYQNSVVRILLGDNKVTQVTLKNEARAEQMVVFLNYLAWARGEGGDRATLPPASLGGLAKYVSKHDAEPKDAEGNINLNLVELDITEVPEEPTREGRAMPSFLPYIVILVGGLAIFGLMAYVINPPMRDDAIYSAITKYQWAIEPRLLRAYLIDERNTRHRKEAQDLLSNFYSTPISQIEAKADNPLLKQGMIKVLESLRGPDQPIVSMRIREQFDGKPSGKAGADQRQKKLQEALVGGTATAGAGGGIMDELARISPAIRSPDGQPLSPQPPPIGHQLIAFAEAPEEANNAHFEIVYNLVPGSAANRFVVEITVAIRTNIEENAVATSNLGLLDEFTLEQLDGEKMNEVRDRIVKGIIGKD
jgi:hypothetical protein